MFIGKCPVCNNNIEVREKKVKGKKVELYACEKAHWVTEDGEFFELSKDSSCYFKIWQNALFNFGYFKLKHSDIRKILNNETIILPFQKYNKTFEKEVVLNLKYGVSINF